MPNFSQKFYNIIKLPQKTTETISSNILGKFSDQLKTAPDLEALRIAYETSDLDEIIKNAEYIRQNFEHIVLLGIGGSSLGAKTLLSLRKTKHVIILESIDSHTVNSVIKSLNLERTAFLTISKSGKTVECISQTLLLMQIVEEMLGKEKISKHFFFLTEDKESPLTNLAKKLDIPIFFHNKQIGGRFSYLSNVALLPACIDGLNIKAIRQGAMEIIDCFLEDKNNFILQACLAQHELFSHGIVETVIMPYIDRFKHLTEWYRQIFAESLGKNGFGITPVDAMGTVDQHSQLQLYIDGPKNKFFTFVLNKDDPIKLKISNAYEKEFNYLLNMSLHDIQQIEASTTIEILQNKNLPIRVINFETIDEKSLSQFMMQLMIETIVIGQLHNINPFGQPGVEERKKLAAQAFQNFKK